MWLSDFPHPTSTYPTSSGYIDESLTDCTAEERRMILVDTACRLYHLPEGY
jgi:predicted TIM-barrel fold metal-dependent hydrolase